MKYLFFIISLTLLVSCNEDVVLPEETSFYYPGVEEALWPYFENFEKEGALRGHYIDLKSLGIEGVLSPINEDNIAGTCQFRGNQPRLVVIDVQFWNRADNLFREFIVFHELGHCVLERGHNETESDNGACLSIMRSGTTGCIDTYSLRNRDYFLDELFSRTGEF